MVLSAQEVDPSVDRGSDSDVTFGGGMMGLGFSGGNFAKRCIRSSVMALAFSSEKPGLTITDDIGRKRRHESSCLAGPAKWTFRVFNPGIYGLIGLKLFLALSTTVLVERHGIGSFLCHSCRDIMRNVIRDLTRRPLPSDLDRLATIRLF